MTPIQTAAQAIAAAHGVDPSQVTELPGGVANHVFRLGPTLILRIPRSPAFIADLHKEAAVIPIARAAGVRTPAIVAQGTIPLDNIPSPYVVMERVHGHDLVTHASAARTQPGAVRTQPSAVQAQPSVVVTQPGAVRAQPGVVATQPGAVGTHSDSVGTQSGAVGTQRGSVGTRPSAEFWAALGREVALIHRVHQEELGSIPEDSGDGRGSADELVERGYLDAETGRWVGLWMGELRGRFGEDLPKVLLHGDLAPQNLMVDDAGRFVAVIDWGDAAWGPRGMEFAKLRLGDVDRVLPAYKDAADVRFETGELEAAVLWFHLQWGLSNLTGPPRIGERHWTAPPASRVLGVLRFLASDPPEPWGSLIKKVDLWV
ncbi:phosphotransferase family protein [Kribbella endophytica]